MKETVKWLTQLSLNGFGKKNILYSSHTVLRSWEMTPVLVIIFLVVCVGFYIYKYSYQVYGKLYFVICIWYFYNKKTIEDD